MPRSSRSARNRRTMALNVVAFVVAVAVVGGGLMFRAAGRDVDQRLSAVFVEPGAADLALLTADAGAELDRAVATGTDVLVAAVLDGRDATAYFGSFACEAGENERLCEASRKEPRAKADEALGQILQAPSPAEVDLFAPVRQVVSHLQRHPAPDGTEVYLNVSGRHDHVAVDLSGPTPKDRVPALAEAVLASGAFPASTDGITVHLVMPTRGPRAAALTELFRSLLDQTGGRLGTVGDRWLSEGSTHALPPFESGDVTAIGAGRVATFTMGAALFDTGVASLRPEAAGAVKEIAERIRALGPTTSVRVEGFADATGTQVRNQVLSEARAKNVRVALAEALGVPAESIPALGRGALPDNGTAAGRVANRRVDVVVTTERSP